MPWQHVSPASDEEIRHYASGLDTGTLKNASPAVVASLLKRIAQQRKQIEQQRRLAASQEPHAYLCVPHGGSPRGEGCNHLLGFDCPRCIEQQRQPAAEEE